VSWAGLAALACCAYTLKALGPVLLGARTLDARTERLLQLLPVPLLAALIAVQTFDGGRALTVDARVPAIAVAGVLVWRRAPFLVVVVAAAATAALLRAVT
jgi:branched-subunit amino acid transport protein